MLTREGSIKYLGQKVTFQQQETTEIKKRIRAAWATFYKYKQELTSKTLRPSTPASLFRHGDHSNDELRLRNMELVLKVKNDERMIQSTQREKGL